MAEQDQSEKTEQPTPFKLQEARKQGNVFKSMEVNHLVALSAGLMLLLSIGERFIHQMFDLCRQLFLDAVKLEFSLDKLHQWAEFRFDDLMVLVSPIIIVLMVAGVLATVIQTGFVFSFHPIKPDIKRINPVEGFKRLFSIKLLFESVKNLVKLAAFTAITYFTITGLVWPIFKLYAHSPNYLPAFFIEEASGLIFKLLLALVLVAILDFIFSRWDYLKRMRMSRRDIKDEVKRREGDPQVRSKRRELEREMRKRSESVSAVSDADLIITNPTHFAVVLKYDKAAMVAPKITGLGSGGLALKIRREASRFGVPIVNDPPLARKLFKRGKIDGYVPETLYLRVAKALSKAYQIKNQRLQRGRML